MSLLELVAEAKRTGDPRTLSQAIPFAQLAGISAELVFGELLGKMSYRETLIGNFSLPALHGGTTGALLESTAIFQLLWQAETTVLPKTISITVDYLRSGRATDTFAKGIVTRHGRRVANVRVEAWQEDRHRPIAMAHAHFLILPGEESAA